MPGDLPSLAVSIEALISSLVIRFLRASLSRTESLTNDRILSIEAGSVTRSLKIFAQKVFVAFSMSFCVLTIVPVVGSLIADTADDIARAFILLKWVLVILPSPDGAYMLTRLIVDFSSFNGILENIGSLENTKRSLKMSMRLWLQFCFNLVELVDTRWICLNIFCLVLLPIL